MICKDCAVAADLVSVVRTYEVGNTVIPANWAGNYIGIRAATEALVYWLHAKCKGPTHCDCQHIIDWEGNRTTNGQATRQPDVENREPAGETS